MTNTSVRVALFSGIVAGMTAFGEALPNNVVYRNDFTTRTSREAIPQIGQTFEATPYPTKTCKLYPYRNTDEMAPYEKLGLQLNGVYSYINFAPMYFDSVGDSRPSYDGWFEPIFMKGTAASHDVLFNHTATVYMEPGLGSTNACFRFYYSPGSTATRTGIALKSLHNVFTNGQLRIQVDMKFPVWYKNKMYSQFVMFPVYDKYMDIESWEGTPKQVLETDSPASPGLFGFRCGDDRTRPYPRYYAGKTAQIGNQYGSTSNLGRIPWARYEVTYDLDNGVVSGGWQPLSGYVMSEVWSNATAYAQVEHPTFASEIKEGLETGTTFSNIPFSDSPGAAGMTNIWKTKGGISGIGFFIGRLGYDLRNKDEYGCRLPGGINELATYKPLADNIRVSWKAPGSDDFVVAYEDDFTTRKYTVLSAPKASAEQTYTAGVEDAGPTIDTFTEYVKGSGTGSNYGYDKYQLVPTAKSPLATTLQPIGVDGWRRIIPDASKPYGRPWTTMIRDEGEGGNMIEIGQNGHYICLAQLIGEEITSGKVKISVDAFVPTPASDFTFLGNRLQRVSVALGPTALYSSLTADVAANTAAGGGVYLNKVTGEEPVTNHVAFTYGANREVVDVPAEALSGEVERKKWYRMELLADLDAKTYDMTITPLSTISVLPDFTPTNEPVVQVTGKPFVNSSVTGIGTFALWGWGYGGTLKYSQGYRTSFDNIRVWKITPSAEEETAATTNLVYYNDLDTRTRYLANSTRQVGRLAYQYDRDDGPDNWIRRNGAGDSHFGANGSVRDDNGNQFLSLGRESGDGHQTYISTPLGKTMADGKVLLSVDIRPPKSWWGRKGGTVVVRLGNSKMQQSETDYSGGFLTSFGLKDKSYASNGGVYSDIVPFASDDSDSGVRTYIGGSVAGSALKWYRFRLKADLIAKKYSVSVYDMGTEHPTFDTPLGECIGTASNLALINPLEEGISSLQVACYAVTSTPGETGMDDQHALIDNIEVSHRKSGMMFYIH